MKRPNFLFIMTDTQATNMVGCYSGKPLNTQNIDSLAAEGIRFNSAYTCSPVCTPARAGLFTGIYANQSGPWTNNVAPISGDVPVCSPGHPELSRPDRSKNQRISLNTPPDR